MDDGDGGDYSHERDTQHQERYFEHVNGRTKERRKGQRREDKRGWVKKKKFSGLTVEKHWVLRTLRYSSLKKLVSSRTREGRSA
jgi:hypothetical protein